MALKLGMLKEGNPLHSHFHLVSIVFSTTVLILEGPARKELTRDLRGVFPLKWVSESENEDPGKLTVEIVRKRCPLQMRTTRECFHRMV